MIIPVSHKTKTIPLDFRADILIDDILMLEIKAVPTLLPAHEAQPRTYPRMSAMRVGLPMNFQANRLKDSLLRLIV